MNEYRATELPPSLRSEWHPSHLDNFPTRIVLETFHPYVNDQRFLEKICTQAESGNPLSEVPHGQEVEDGLRRMAKVLDAVIEDPVNDYRLEPLLFIDDVATVEDRPGMVLPRIENARLACVTAQLLGLTALADLMAIAPVSTTTEAYYLEGGLEAVESIKEIAGYYPKLRITPDNTLIDGSLQRGDNLYKIKLMGKDGRDIPSCDVMDAVMQSQTLAQPLCVVATLMEEGMRPQQERVFKLMDFLTHPKRPLACVKAYHDSYGTVQSIEVWDEDERAWAVAKLIAKAMDYEGDPVLLHTPRLSRQPLAAPA